MAFKRILALCLLFAPTLLAEEIVGRVVRVADGDTITVLFSESSQSFASESVGSRVPRDRNAGRILDASPVGSRAPRDRQPVAAARVEYRAGNKMPVGARAPAPVNSTWPDTGYWLSVNSNKRHNRNCENYRKTRGYPCQKNEGDRCGKCGG